MTKQNSNEAISFSEPLSSLFSDKSSEISSLTVELQKEFIINHRGCFVTLAHSILETEDYKTAYELLSKLHELDIPEATYLMSMMHLNDDVIEQDIDLAVDMLIELADSGYEPAIELLEGE